MGKNRASEIWPVVHAERRALLEDLQGLEAGRWQTPSLCPGWDVHDVLAHLIDSAKTTRLGFIRRMFAVGFDFDRDNAQGIAKERQEDPRLTLASFAGIVDATATPPVNRATRLVEAFVHGDDIRVPLGLSRSYPVESVAHALDYQLKTPVKFGGGKETAARVRLAASDTSYAHGTGPEVTGPALGLLLAVSGRPVNEDEFSGPGAAEFLKQLRNR